MASFIITFHTSRRDNLEQMLRFLAKRETSLEEVILVCQDSCQYVETDIPHTLINMNLDTYRKAIMYNNGVQEAKSDVVVLLDGDRILPKDYFSKVEKIAKNNIVVATEKLLRIKKPCTDFEIDRASFPFDVEMKDKNFSLDKKNLFAGNTAMLRQTYWDVGGMDESFVGYGHCDTDMTRAVAINNIQTQWMPQEEIHLYHHFSCCLQNVIFEGDHVRLISELNKIRYLRKWKENYAQNLANIQGKIRDPNLPNEIKETFADIIGLTKRFV